ncbi:MAG TPA: hypothetical protein VLA77_01120 [Candidatus Saccharimonadales bacterium]|nr:hypothetical protein [Candidatus Saccharimonadales bacterium]
MVKCLVLGLAGSGKSSLVNELCNRGRSAFDLDQMANLSGWINKQGIACEYSNSPEWRANHDFVWNIKAITEFLNVCPKNQIIYMAGIAANSLELVQLGIFDAVAFLDVSPKTIFTRLKSPSRHTPFPFDCTPEHESWINGLVPQFRRDMVNFGAVRLNAEQDIKQIVDDLISCCEN